MKSIDKRVYKQPVGKYLTFLGIPCNYYDRLDSPLYAAISSQSFVVRGNYWMDYRMDKGGDAGDLAFLMKKDPKEAIKSLYECAGLNFTEDINIERKFTNRHRATDSLLKVKNAFKIDIRSDCKVSNYLRSRMVTEKSSYLFSYIPEGELKNVLTTEEIRLTGLGKYEGKIILWYLIGGNPVYYCIRDIDTKEFRKGFVGNGILQHPIWNYDVLYTDPIVIWSEGMFDCSSLIEMGYSSAGEITCNPIHSHYEPLIEALRWRNTNRPNWKFIICLDNDVINSMGKRSGNWAAEKMAITLWSMGVDFLWVKHDPTQAGKVDINQLHQERKEDEIRAMIDSAKPVFEQLTVTDDSMFRCMSLMMHNCDIGNCNKLVDAYMDKYPNSSLKEIMKRMTSEKLLWRDVYDQRIEEMFLYGSSIGVYYRDNIYENKSGFSYDEFNKGDVIKNLLKYQKNQSAVLKYENLLIPKKLKEWKITKEYRSSDKFNLYRPTDYLLQTPDPEATMPKCWDELFDNLCSGKEKEWLLNHMATYVQTLKKPFTIPVVLGEVGTGKTSLFKLFGLALGGFKSVSNSEIEGSFNGYMLTPVLFLDELSCSKGDTLKIKNKLKMLINEHVLVNIKFQEPMDSDINGYIAIGSNEFKMALPLIIEKGDRRYSVISGGKNQRYEDTSKYEEWEKTLGQFILYLLSRPIDERMANIPLETEMKEEIKEQSKPYNMSIIEEFFERYKNKDLPYEILRIEGVKDWDDDYYTEKIKISRICDIVNSMGKISFRLSTRTIKPYIEELGYKIKSYIGQAVVYVKFNDEKQDEETEKQEETGKDDTEKQDENNSLFGS